MTSRAGHRTRKRSFPDGLSKGISCCLCSRARSLNLCVFLTRTWGENKQTNKKLGKGDVNTLKSSHQDFFLSVLCSPLSRRNKVFTNFLCISANLVDYLDSSDSRAEPTALYYTSLHQVLGLPLLRNPFTPKRKQLILSDLTFWICWDIPFKSLNSGKW